MKKNFTIKLTRVEIGWLYRQLRGAKDKSEAKLKEEYSTERQVEYDTLTKLCINCSDLIGHGESNRLKLDSLKQELEEAILLCEEPTAVIEARKRLDNLPKEEDYRVTFDRETAKFTLKLLDREIEWMRKTNIPNIEKRDASMFTDVIQTKSYYLNKAKRAKAILEELKKKLEKELL